MKAHQRRPGLWEAKAYDETTGKRKSYYGTTAEEAIAKASASLVPRSDADRLWGFYEASFWPAVARRSENWKDQIAWAMVKYIAPEFGEYFLKDLDRATIQRWFNRLALMKDKDGRRVLVPSSINKIKIVFSGILNMAEADGLIPSNPVRYVRTEPVIPVEARSLTAEEFWKLYRAPHPQLRPVLLLMGACGLRIGEACAVSWSEIRDGILMVRHQIRQPKGGAERTSDLKTPQSRRDIPIPADLLKEFEAVRTGDVFVCSNSDGGYLLPTNVTRLLNSALKTAKIGHVKPHELRHTFISLLENEVEAPRIVVAELSGKAKHEGIDRYSRSQMSRRKQAMTDLWKHLSADRTTTCTTESA